MTRAVERSFCVGAVGISMAVVKSDRTLRDILEREISCVFYSVQS